MKKAHSRTNKRHLLPRLRPHRVNYIAILPSLMTLLNGVCGFVSVVLASRANEKGLEAGAIYFTWAGYVVLFAMVFDMLDGRLARMSHSTSSFGGQLDSLCDMVSFGIAPAFLMLQIVSAKLEPIIPFSGSLFHRFIWLAALAYISCTAIRLARFNVENEDSEAHHMSFVGLPSPAAAGAIVSLIIFLQEEMPNLEQFVIYALPFLTVLVALLMVSQVAYPHIVNVYVKGKKPFGTLIQVLFYIFLAVYKWQVALVLIFWFFVVSGMARSIWTHVVHHRRPLPGEDVQNIPTPQGPTPTGV